MHLRSETNYMQLCENKEKEKKRKEKKERIREDFGLEPN